MFFRSIFVFFWMIFLAACAPSSENSSSSGASTLPSSRPSMNGKIAKDPGYQQCIRTAEYQCGVNFVTAYAQNNYDYNICNEFSEEGLRDSCREMVITQTAKRTFDETRCGAIGNPDKKAVCIQEVIMEKGIKKADPTVCSDYVLSSKDTDTLENMKDRCMIHIISQLEPTEKTEGLCGLIVNENARNACRNRVKDFLKNPQENPENISDTNPDA